jgi:hypothetical protein
MLLIAVPSAALAERPEDRVWIRGGAFRATIDTFLQVDNPALGLDGTRIDFERDLGFDRGTWLPKVDAGVRLGRAFRIEGDYFNLDRVGGATLDEEIRIDDTLFPIDADLAAAFRTAIWRIALGWSPHLGENGEFGVALGVHLTDASYDFVADLDGVILSESRSETVPLPNVSLYGSHSFSETVNLNARIDFFALKVGDYRGQLVDVQATIGARLHRHIGAGLGYRYVDYNLRIRKEDLRAEADYAFHGPFAFLELAF